MFFTISIKIPDLQSFWVFFFLNWTCLNQIALRKKNSSPAGLHVEDCPLWNRTDDRHESKTTYNSGDCMSEEQNYIYTESLNSPFLPLAAPAGWIISTQGHWAKGYKLTWTRAKDTVKLKASYLSWTKEFFKRNRIVTGEEEHVSEVAAFVMQWCHPVSIPLPCLSFTNNC